MGAVQGHQLDTGTPPVEASERLCSHRLHSQTAANQRGFDGALLLARAAQRLHLNQAQSAGMRLAQAFGQQLGAQ